MTFQQPAMGTPSLDEATIQAFVTSTRGPVLRPGAPGYDEARVTQNGMVDRRPALIARCSGRARSVNDDGLVIDLSLMRGIHADPQARIARVQGGAT
jgi:hypothetical protein